MLREIARHHGLPVALYSDRQGIFHPDKRIPLTLEEQLKGGPDPTQVGRALREVSIRWIPASSPQAKSRIERLFQTFQDRLLAELRLAGVTDRDGANAFLPGFVKRYNTRFAQPAADTHPAFRPWPTGQEPDAVFCFKYLRTVANDNTVSVGTRLLQILPGPHSRSYAKAQIEVHERLDGTVVVLYQEHALTLQTPPAPPPERIPACPHRRPQQTDPGSLQAIRDRKRREAIKTSGRYVGQSAAGPDHIWRQMARANTILKRAREAERTRSLAE